MSNTSSSVNCMSTCIRRIRSFTLPTPSAGTTRCTNQTAIHGRDGRCSTAFAQPLVELSMTTKGRVIYFNGEFVPESEAKISIYYSALMFGDMVFEMTRSFNKVQFKLREHIERLY